MITQMKKYSFLVFHKDYNNFLTSLREAGVVHIQTKNAGGSDADLQSQLNLLQQVNKTIADASAYLPADSAPVNYVSKEQVTALDFETLNKSFADLVEEKQSVETLLAQTRKEQERMAVWGTFSAEKLDSLKSAGYNVQFFTCSAGKYDASWEVLYNAFVVAEEGGRVYFVTINSSSEAFAIDAEEIILNEHNCEQLQADVNAQNGLLVAKQAQLEAWAIANIGNLKNYALEVQHGIDWSMAKLNTESLADDSLRLVEGYCPIDATDALDSMLATQDVYCQISDPTPDDPTPIKLHNNWFTHLFECLTGMYGWPNYGEFDPTPILGPFFLLFFSLCIGDAGYGLLLILAGYLIYKEKLKIEMFSGLGPIIMALGVGTTIVGYMMGGFFGIDLYAATWYPEAAKIIMFKSWIGTNGVIPVAAMGQNFDVMMIFALVIGVVHICLAMTIKCICSTRRFGFKETISAWGWLILIVGGLLVIILSSLGCFGAKVTSTLLIIIAAISALGIFIFNKPGRNPLLNIGAGLWDTYGMATGILGDVLSYIRLYALGLAGGMLGMAFNQLGTMVLGETPNVGSWIGFVAILIFGHVLNLLMSCLGAFVHPLRLTFVEYFKNSGYEGSGKIYHPFKK